MSSPNNNNQITEDVPVMRSVALHAASPPPMLRTLDATPLKTASVQSPSSAVINHWKPTSAMAIPDYYKLERSHIAVAADIATVASRIEQTLEQHSISARFHNSVAECETADHLHFNVRLWQSEQTIVEVQRLSGCCFLFRQAAKSVMQAAKGQSNLIRQRTFTIPSCVPKIDNGAAAVEESLNIAADLLKSPRLDAHVMAMESLSQLTNSEHANFAAHAIMCGNGDFMETIICLIETSRMCRSESQLSAMEIESVCTMRRHALVVLANCLSSLERSGELSHANAKYDLLNTSNLTQALVFDMERSERHPHEAMLAAKCLQYLASPATLHKLGVSSVVASAQECRHLLLQAEARKLGARLQ